MFLLCYGVIETYLDTTSFVQIYGQNLPKTLPSAFVIFDLDKTSFVQILLVKTRPIISGFVSFTLDKTSFDQIRRAMTEVGI
jgi:hypothetical protein